MNRRSFFKAAGAVMLGGLVGAQVQAETAPKYAWDLGEMVELTPLPFPVVTGEQRAAMTAEEINTIVRQGFLNALAMVDG